MPPAHVGSLGSSGHSYKHHPEAFPWRPVPPYTASAPQSNAQPWPVFRLSFD